MSLRLLAELMFWLGVAALFYTHAGYPVLLVIVSRLRPRPVRKADLNPGVSVIITAYNEEPVIEVRPFFELDDFGESPAIDRARKLGKELEKRRA